MKIPVALARLLALSAHEERLLGAASATPQSTSTLARKARVPRTSALRTLEGLQERGLLRQEKLSKRRSGWVEGDLSLLANKNQKEKDHEVMVYRGRKELMELARMADTFEGERIVWLRGSRVWEGYNKQDLRGRFVFLLRLFAKKGVVVEEIASDRAPGLDIKHGGREVSAAHEKLLRILTVVPDRYLSNSYSDMMLFRDSVSFMNWYDETAVLVRNPDLVRLFKQLLEYMGDTGKRLH